MRRVVTRSDTRSDRGRTRSDRRSVCAPSDELRIPTYGRCRIYLKVHSHCVVPRAETRTIRSDLGSLSLTWGLTCDVCGANKGVRRVIRRAPSRANVTAAASASWSARRRPAQAPGRCSSRRSPGRRRLPPLVRRRSCAPPCCLLIYRRLHSLRRHLHLPPPPAPRVA